MNIDVATKSTCYLNPFFVQTDKKLKHIGFHENKVRK